jgi:hypothetical protein
MIKNNKTITLLGADARLDHYLVDCLLFKNGMMPHRLAGP